MTTGFLFNRLNRISDRRCVLIDNTITTTFTPSHISQITGIDGGITGIGGVGKEIEVAVRGLVQILPGENYGRIINDPQHPDSLNVTPAARRKLPLKVHDLEIEIF